MTIHTLQKESRGECGGGGRVLSPLHSPADLPPWEVSCRAQNTLGKTLRNHFTPPAQKVFAVLDRYRLQAIAREILTERGKHRVGVCHRHLAPGQGAVKIGISKGRASYGGLMACGSPWVCAVCADKISKKRTLEVEKAVRFFQGIGGIALHAPLTIPHRLHESLSELIVKMGKARQIMAHRPSWLRFRGVMGLRAYIRALEVTWGENGWHPHLHDLWLLDKRFDEGSCENVRRWVLDMWQSACETAGLPKPNDRGVRVIPVDNAASYVSKWGIEAEMTRLHTKRGRAGSYTPFDLLRAIHEGEKHLVGKFVEYAIAFHGRRQLILSRGLRKLAGLGEEIPDEEIVAGEDDGWRFLMFIAPSQWKVILEKEKRWQILKLAESEGEEGVRSYIRHLVGIREPGQEG